MVERDALLISPVIRGAGCWADVSSPNNRRRSTQPAGTAEPTSEPTERMFRLRAKARPTIMPAIFREVPSCVKLCFHAGRRRALISGCSRRLVLSGGASHRSEPSVRSTDINPQRLRSTQPIPLSSTENCRQKWRYTTLLDKPTTRPEGALRNNGFDYSALWFVLLVCVRTHRWGGEKQTWATVLDKRFSGESATIKL